MPRTKGTPKTGGRQKGTQNHLTPERKKIISQLLEEEALPTLHGTFGDLDTKDRWDIFIKLLGFVLPKPQSIKFEDVTPTESPVISMVRNLMLQDNGTTTGH